MSAVEAIGCDRTVTNTGWKSGVVHNNEVKCRRPLQWFICYYILTSYLIGICLITWMERQQDQHHLAVELENTSLDVRNALSQILGRYNQKKSLLDIVKTVNTGICNPELSAMDPGRISHSRWLTCANRVLRLYVYQTSPTIELQTLANYIVKSYAPVWFDIKKNYTVKDGPKHILKVVKITRHPPDNIKKIINPVIQRKAFFCHPENMMLAMIMDEIPHIRELGYRSILKSKNEPSAEGYVRDTFNKFQCKRIY